MKNATTGLFMLLLCSISGGAQALETQNCGTGRITKLALSGDGSVFHAGFTVQNRSRGNAAYALWRNDYWIEMWQGNSTTDWSDRLRLLQLAYALQVPVLVISSSSSCQVTPQELSITLCNMDADCS